MLKSNVITLNFFHSLVYTVSSHILTPTAMCLIICDFIVNKMFIEVLITFVHVAILHFISSLCLIILCACHCICITETRTGMYNFETSKLTNFV